MPDDRSRSSSAPVLQVSGLNVYYGHSHALQGVDLTLDHGVLSVVGRNGMGKTTLCQAIMGLVPASSGSIRFGGQELTSLGSSQIARMGIGYVPQGRRLWPSLTVDEHLRMSAGHEQRILERRTGLRHVSPGWPNARPTAVGSCPAASSRCWQSPARCCSTRICWSWTSRPRALPLSLSRSWRRC